MSAFNKKYGLLLSIGLSMLSVLFLLCVHLILPTMFNTEVRDERLFNRIDERFLAATVEYHESHPAFARRPLTSMFIQGIVAFAQVGYGEAFIVVNMLLFLGVFIFLAILARDMTKKHEYSWLSIVFFLASPSILFAFFHPVYTYDEPLQYLCLFAALYAVFHKRFILFCISFFFALVARETSILLLPSYLIYAYFFADTSVSLSIERIKKQWKLLFASVSSIAGYGLFLFLFLQQENLTALSINYIQKERFGHWAVNMQSLWHGVESFVVIALVLLLPCFLLACVYRLNKQLLQAMTYAFILAVLINTPIVLWTARAREFRLFALPLIFFWPIAGQLLFLLKQQYFPLFKKKMNILFFGTAMIPVLYLGYHLIWQYYFPTASGGFEWGYRMYALGVFMGGVVLLSTVILKKVKTYDS